MGPVLHGLREPQHVVVGVVERGRRDADHVGLAPVAEHAVRRKVFEQCAATLTSTGDPYRKLATTLLRVRRRDDLQRAGQACVDQLFQVSREAQRAFAQYLDADAIEQVQRSTQRRQ